MMNKIVSTLALSSLAIMAAACHDGFDMRPHDTDCYGSGSFRYCETEYYSADGSVETSRDMITDISQEDEIVLQSVAKHYSEKFALGEEQGMKIAQTVRDYSLVQTRSDQDVADFARRLYGVDPMQVAAAVGSAQAGDNSKLNVLVNEAAKNFNTTSDNMKNVVKTLHGKLLEQQGISI